MENTFLLIHSEANCTFQVVSLASACDWGLLAYLDGRDNARKHLLAHGTKEYCESIKGGFEGLEHARRLDGGNETLRKKVERLHENAERILEQINGTKKEAV